MKGVEISVYSCALVVRNLWLGVATRSSSIPALQSNRGLQSPAPPQPRGLRFLDDHGLHGYREFLIDHSKRSRGCLDITLNQQSEDPEIPVMPYENARDKRNSSRALDESSLFKVGVQVEQVDQVDQAGEEERHR